jgi:hypothetical protein
VNLDFDLSIPTGRKESPQARKRRIRKEYYEVFEKGRDYTGEDTHRQGPLFYKKRDVIRKAKAVPCLDCRVSYPHYVMHLDHVRGVKKFNLAKFKTHSMEEVVEEIAKCDPVCSNCHAERTWGDHRQE